MTSLTWPKSGTGRIASPHVCSNRRNSSFPIYTQPRCHRTPFGATSRRQPVFQASVSSQPLGVSSVPVTNGVSSLSSSLEDESSATRPFNDLHYLISQIPFTKLAVWAVVGFAAYQLSDFFGIVMGTFVLSFIGNSFVLSAQEFSPLIAVAPDSGLRRKMLVLTYFSIIAATVITFGVLTIPDIAREAVDFVKRLQSDNIWVVLVEKARSGLGDQIMDSLERFVYLASSNDLSKGASLFGGELQEWTAERSVALGMAVAGIMKGYTTTAVSITTGLLSSVTKFALQVFVSLVLSFMLVWDLPAIVHGMTSLKMSRVAPVYQEVAPVLGVFGKLFGKALEAQARIALVNTALTAAGMWVLQIPSIGLLSLFVFLCSFIPIAGCIISTIPIGFVALTEYGFIRLWLAIVMVGMVHFVEAYMLNPAIYSAHLKLHPLIVLSVLVVAEHSMGFWGLMLAVPLTVFALDYCIKYPESSVTEVGAKELEKVLCRPEDEAQAPEQCNATYSNQ